MKEFTFLLAGMVIGAVMHHQRRRAEEAEAMARSARRQSDRDGQGH